MKLIDQLVTSIEQCQPFSTVSTHCRRRRSSLLALPYSYSINSSALSRIDVGTSRPSALAVFILSTASYSDRTCAQLGGDLLSQSLTSKASAGAFISVRCHL